MAKFPTYFFLNDLLHKRLHINRGEDIITTWCYPLRKRITYTYSEVRKNKRPAFTTMEICGMINRSRKTVEWAILDGNVKEPQHTYGIDEHMRKYKHMWSEADVLALHDYFSTVHYGHPRKDGLITPLAMPSRRELLAMMRNEEMLYVKGEDGEFRPVWHAQDFS